MCIRDRCKEWAQWVMDSLPKTKEGGFQHITSDTLNDGELWDDTLFMTAVSYTHLRGRRFLRHACGQ